MVWAAILDSYMCCMRPMRVMSPSGSPRATRKNGRVADRGVQPWEVNRTARSATVAKTVEGRRTAVMALMAFPDLLTHS